MCDILHPVALLAQVAAPPQDRSDPAEAGHGSPGDLPPGFMTLSEEEYRTIVLQESIDKYYEVHPTPISIGQWASVYKCRSRSSGAEFAAKFCDKARLGLDATREIVHEMAALHRCRPCERIVQLHQLFETDQQFVLVMELGSGGDLQGVLDSDQVPYEADVVRFMRNLLESLTFLHERSIAHLDIKPQNLVLTGTFPDCDIKLCDLEISRVISSGQEIREMLGTPDYVAPEILRFDPVTLAADLWSVGVLAYVLLTGFTPFGGDSDAETFRNIAKADLEFPDELFDEVSESAKDFVRRCLLKEPRDRATAQQLLSHRWLKHPSAAAPPTLSVPIITGSRDAPHPQPPSVAGICNPGGLRRSVSKSREALSVKVSQSNLKKNISKSRERLCDLKFGLARSAEAFPLCLRASVAEVPNSRPPWKGAGPVRGPAVSSATPLLERVNSFRVRDQYQSQVSASLAAAKEQTTATAQGSTQSLDSNGSGPSPFVRHSSLRGRRSSQQNGNADLRSSLRRTRTKDGAMNRRNSSQVDLKTMQENGKAKEPGMSTRGEPEASPRPEKRRNSRKEPLLPVRESKPMTMVVDIVNDEEDVFTRLRKDRRKDSSPRLRRSREFERDDDEKENKLAGTGRNSRRSSVSPTPPINENVTKVARAPDSPDATSPRLNPRAGERPTRRRSETSAPRRPSPPERRSSLAVLTAPSNRRQASLERGLSSPAVRLAAVIDERVVWEQAQALGPQAPAVSEPPRSPATRTRRELTERRPREADAFQRGAPVRSSLRSSRREVVRQSSAARLAAPPPATSSAEHGRQLRKSSTQEDCRRLRKSSTNEDCRRIRKSSTNEDCSLSRSSTEEDCSRRLRKSSTTEDCRRLRKSSTAEDFSRLAVQSRLGDEKRMTLPSGCDSQPKRMLQRRRSNSLGSSEASSDVGSDSYSVISWEEKAPSTELRPVTTTRAVPRPHSRTSGLSTPASPGARPSSRADGDGASSVCGNTVARAVSRFHALADEARQRKPSAHCARSASPRERLPLGRSPGLRSA